MTEPAAGTSVTPLRAVPLAETGPQATALQEALPRLKMPDPAVLSRLYVLQRDREDFLGEEKSLTLRMKARLRRLASTTCEDHAFKCKRCNELAAQWYAGKGDEAMVYAAAELNAPLLLAQKPIHSIRLATEREMVKIAQSLHVAPFVEETLGFGFLGLAQIVAEAGDLSDYSNPGKLWKRFGLAVIDGRAQRRVAGAGAIAQGYSPKRRAVMFVIGDSLIKKQGAYRGLYLERKAYEQATHPDLRPIVHHRRAQRYMEKRLLRELWKAWRAN